jgi:hypothetical protein
VTSEHSFPQGPKYGKRPLRLPLESTRPWPAIPDCGDVRAVKNACKVAGILTKPQRQTTVRTPRRRLPGGFPKSNSGTPRKSYQGNPAGWVRRPRIEQSKVNTLGKIPPRYTGSLNKLHGPGWIRRRFKGFNCTLKPIWRAWMATGGAVSLSPRPGPRPWGRGQGKESRADGSGNAPFAANFFIARPEDRFETADVNINDLVSCSYNCIRQPRRAPDCECLG